MLFEDFAIGNRYELGRHTFTAEDIIQFATRYDPQPFHTDEVAAARSHFGGLVASVYMKLQARAIAERGTELAQSGPSPGFRNLRWPRPVFAGDTLSYASEVQGKRELKTRPDWGVVFFHITARNQRNELAFEFEATAFIARRSA